MQQRLAEQPHSSPRPLKHASSQRSSRSDVAESKDSSSAPSALHSYRASLLRSCDLPSWVHAGALPPALAQRVAQSSMFVRAPLLVPPRRRRVREQKSWEALLQAEQAEEKAAEGGTLSVAAGAKQRTAMTATATTPRFHGLSDVRFRADHSLAPRSAAATDPPLSSSSSHAAAAHTAAASSSVATAAAAVAAPSNVFPYTAATASAEFQTAFHRVAAQTKEALISKERIEVYTKKPVAAATGGDTQQPHQATDPAVPPVWPPVEFTDGSVVIARHEQLKGSGNRLAESGGSLLNLGPHTASQSQRSNLSANSSASRLPEAFGPALRLAAAAAASSNGYYGGTLGSPASSSAAVVGSQSQPLTQQSQSARGAGATSGRSPPKHMIDAAVLPLTSELAPARYVHPPSKSLIDSSVSSPAAAGALASSPSALALVAAHLSVAARSPAATKLAQGSDSPLQLLEGVVANGGVFITAASAAAAAADGADPAASTAAVDPVISGSASAPSSSRSPQAPRPHPPSTSPPALMKLTGIQPGTTERQIRWCFESVGIEVRRVRMQGLYAASTSMDSFGVTSEASGSGGSETRLRSNGGAGGGSESCALVEYFARGAPARRIKRQVYERLYRLQGGEGSSAELALRALTKRAGGLGDAPRFYGLDTSPSVIDRRARLLSKVAQDMDVAAKLFMLMSSTPALNVVTHRVDKMKLAQPVDLHRARGGGGDEGAAAKTTVPAAPESDISKELSNLFAQGSDAWMDSGSAAAPPLAHMQHQTEEAEEEQLIAASAAVPSTFVTISPPSPRGSSSSSLQSSARSHSRKRSSLLMDPSLSAGEAILSISVDSSATLHRALSPLSHQAAATAAAAAALESKRDSEPRRSPSPSPSASSDLVSPQRALQFSLHRRATADRARDTKQALKSQALEEHAAAIEEEQRRAAAAATAAAASAAHDEREFERAAKRAERAAQLGVTAEDDEDAHLLRDDDLPVSSDAAARRQLPLQLHHIAAATRSGPRASRFRVPLSSLVPSLAPSAPFVRSASSGVSSASGTAAASPSSLSPPPSVPASPGTTVVRISLRGIAGNGDGGNGSGSIPSSPVSASSPRFQARPMTHVNSRKLAEFQAKMEALHSPASPAAQIQQQAVAARKAAVAATRRKG